jgi:transposase
VVGRPNSKVVLSESEREELVSITHSRSLPQSLVGRAQIVLLSAQGLSNQDIATRFGVSAPTVSLWRQRYRGLGLAGLHGEVRPGRPRSYDEERVAELINTVLHHQPEGSSHWSVRTVAAQAASPRVRWHAISHFLGCSRTAARVSSSLPTRSSSKKCVTWSASTSIRPTRRAGVVCGREKPNPSPGAHATGAADGAWIR